MSQQRPLSGADIAINIADLTALPPPLIQLLLPHLTTNQVVAEPGQLDGRAVLGQERCDLARLAAAIALLRRQGYGHARLRVYQRTGGRWTHAETLEVPDDDPTAQRWHQGLGSTCWGPRRISGAPGQPAPVGTIGTIWRASCFGLPSGRRSCR